MLRPSVICGGSMGLPLPQLYSSPAVAQLWRCEAFPLSQPQHRFFVSTLPAQLLEPSEAGCSPFPSAFLAVPVFLVLLGDLLLSLQTPLRFPLVDQASPDLCRENEEL